MHPTCLNHSRTHHDILWYPQLTHELLGFLASMWLTRDFSGVHLEKNFWLKGPEIDWAQWPLTTEPGVLRHWGFVSLCSFANGPIFANSLPCVNTKVRVYSDRVLHGVFYKMGVPGLGAGWLSTHCPWVQIPAPPPCFCNGGVPLKVRESPFKRPCLAGTCGFESRLLRHKL